MHDRLGAIGDLKLAEDIRYVVADRFSAQHQPLGDQRLDSIVFYGMAFQEIVLLNWHIADQEQAVLARKQLHQLLAAR